MARMDLKLRRDAPGMSVFWMILIVGAAVFLVVAIVLLRANGATEPIEEANPPQIVAGEGDEPPGTTSFDPGEVAEGATQEPGELPGEAGELDEALPEDGLEDDTEEAGTVGAVDADPAETPVETDASEAADVPVEETPVDPEGQAVEEAPEESAVEDEAEIDAPEDEIVTDPDPGRPTESGPEGRDDEVIIE